VPFSVLLLVLLGEESLGSPWCAMGAPDVGTRGENPPQRLFLKSCTVREHLCYYNWNCLRALLHWVCALQSSEPLQWLTLESEVVEKWAFGLYQGSHWSPVSLSSRHGMRPRSCAPRVRPLGPQTPPPCATCPGLSGHAAHSVGEV